MSDVAVVGNLARDRVDGGPARPGGGPFFAALALGLLERDAQILTRCADADLPLLGEPLQALGTPVTVLPARHTAAFDHHYDGELRTTHVTGIGDPWSPADAAHLAPAVRWVHVAPLARSDFPPDTLAALAGGGRRRLSLDGQGLVRVPGLGLLTEDAAFDRAMLASISVLKLSEEEARIVAGGAFDTEVARALGVSEIVVTLGSKGEVVWLDGVATHVPTDPVHGVETTGAGDAFMVGYVTARSDGDAPVEAARRGSALVARMLAARRRDR